MKAMITAQRLFSTILIISVISMLPATTQAQKKSTKKGGYRLSLTIKGCTDSIMYMGNYYAGKTYATDTARINKKGQFVFERSRTLMPGLYFFTNTTGRYVEFAIHNDETYVDFTTDDRNWTQYMKVKGSLENELFFNYHRFNGWIYSQIDSANKVKTDEAAFVAYREKMMDKMDSMKYAIIDSYPHSLVTLMMNATREPIVPAKDEKGNELDDRARYLYYMDHYFDNVDLTDDALIRTPEAIFQKRMLDFFDKYLKGADAQTICQYADTLIERARPSKENFKYLVHTITEKYLQSNIMGYDAVYVHLIKRYYATGDAYWSSPSVIDEQVKRAETWDRLLIGKVAPDLYMRDDMGVAHNLHSMPGKYKLLIFWSPTCGHCKTMIPQLYKKYAEYRDIYNISAYAVLSEPDDATRPKWRKFIKDNNLDWINIDGGEANIDWHEVYDIVTTPQIFLLDENNKILAKRLNADLFEQIITILEKKK